MISQQKYWNPVLETLAHEKIPRLQLEKFKRIFSWAYERSKFHRGLYEKAGIKPSDIRSFDDVRRIPTVEKSMMRGIQRKDPFPYGDALCVPLEEVSEFRQTSGTTGQPVYQADTWQDWEWWAESWAYILWAQGYRPKDRVFLPFGYNVFVAFWAGHYAAEKIGAEVVPGGVLDTQARILKIQELQCTAMMATPTYVLGMADTAKNKMGIDPRSLAIRKITCAGEPGASMGLWRWAWRISSRRKGCTTRIPFRSVCRGGTIGPTRPGSRTSGSARSSCGTAVPTTCRREPGSRSPN